MRAIRTALLAIAAFFAWPAAAVPTHPPEEEAQVATAVIDAEMQAYGEWMARLLALEAPVQSQLVALGPVLQSAEAAGGTPRQFEERVRPVVARALVVIDAAMAEIDALERPEFASMELPEDVRPAAIVQQLQTVNRQLRIAIDAFNPLLDAFRNNDGAAVEAAGTRMLASLGLVFESQVVLARAGQTATPRDDPTWALGNFELIFFRAGARLFAAWRPFERPRIDYALPADMIALADELDANAEQGTQRLDAELEIYAEDLADARESGDPSRVMVMRRAMAALGVTRGYFPLSRELAMILRREATALRGQPVTQQSTVRLFTQLRPIRERMDEIGRQVAAGLAAPQ